MEIQTIDKTNYDGTIYWFGELGVKIGDPKRPEPHYLDCEGCPVEDRRWAVRKFGAEPLRSAMALAIRAHTGCEGEP